MNSNFILMTLARTNILISFQMTKKREKKVNKRL